MCKLGMDGFTVISSCFCAVTIAITFALIIQVHFGSPQLNPHGAIATDDQMCSEIGVNILKDGGNSIDATIASLLCLSVTHPHLAGPGGGGVMLIHDHKSNSTHILDFMTALPKNHSRPLEQFAEYDGRSIGVPGFLKGLEEAHKRYGGGTSWGNLFKPAIAVARRGFSLSKHLSDELHRLMKRQHVGFKFSTNFKNDFFPNGVFPPVGTVITRKKFAHFLETVSNGGADEFYLLTYGTEVIDAMRKAGSNVSVHDFHNYMVKSRPVLHKNIKNKTVVTVGPPFGGAQVVSGLNLLQEFNIDPLASSAINFYEAISQGLLYGQTIINNIIDAGLGESNVTSSSFVDGLEFSADVSYGEVGSIVPDLPATQVSVIDTLDVYVTAIAGLGSSFGSGVMTEHDVILNNHLAQLPPQYFPSEDSSEDFGRPYSSYTPLILMDDKNVCGKRMVLSTCSSGAMLQVLGQVLFKNLDMSPAIIEPRIALGSNPNSLLIYEFGNEGKQLSSEVRQALKANHFNITNLYQLLGVNGVSKVGDTVTSFSDIRMGGISSRIYSHQDL